MDGEKERSHLLIRQIDKKYLIKPSIDSTKMTGYFDLIKRTSSSFASIFLSSKKRELISPRGGHFIQRFFIDVKRLRIEEHKPDEFDFGVILQIIHHGL